MTSESKLRSEVARLTSELGEYERRAVEAERRAATAEHRAKSAQWVLQRLLRALGATSVADVERSIRNERDVLPSAA